MFGYTIVRGKARKNRKETPLRTLRKSLIIGSFIGLAMVGIVNAEAPHYGTGTDLPYPLSVGDTFAYGARTCVTAYAWHDDYSAVASCTRQGKGKTTYIAHDGETDTWDTWSGRCIRLHRDSYKVTYVRVPAKCYGPSLLDGQGQGK